MLAACTPPRCVALLCVALRCVALRCFALRCFALRCFALLCVALRCVALRCFGLCCTSQRAFCFLGAHAGASLAETMSTSLQRSLCAEVERVRTINEDAPICNTQQHLPSTIDTSFETRAGTKSLPSFSRQRYYAEMTINAIQRDTDALRCRHLNRASSTILFTTVSSLPSVRDQRESPLLHPLSYPNIGSKRPRARLKLPISPTVLSVQRRNRMSPRARRGAVHAPWTPLGRGSPTLSTPFPGSALAGPLRRGPRRGPRPLGKVAHLIAPRFPWTEAIEGKRDGLTTALVVVVVVVVASERGY
jgi:hypothetical protein